MTINILTLFPEFFSSCLQTSILKRAQDKQVVKINVIDLRNFTHDERQTADDRPFGGGPGMVMKIEPIAEALESLAAKNQKGRVFLTSASGQQFTQQLAQEWSHEETLTFICGHYQGVDQRVADHLIDGEVRIGDFVLTGGESAVVVIVDTLTRLLPGVLGNEMSVTGEAHEIPGQGSYPDYTRPESFKGWEVPAVLLTGNHAEIAKWREANRKKID